MPPPKQPATDDVSRRRVLMSDASLVGALTRRLLASRRRGPVESARTAPGTPLDLVVDVLAAYRLTRLVTADLIGEPFRQAVVRRVGVAPPDEDGPPVSAQEMVDADPSAPRLATLVTCRWCTGAWVAAGVCAARTLAPRTWSPLGWGLALSAGAALVARAEDE